LAVEAPRVGPGYVNITYKILYNDAVAMTGGQPSKGHLNPCCRQIANQMAAEGCGSAIVVMSDEPNKYGAGAFSKGSRDSPPRRSRFQVQRSLRRDPRVSPHWSTTRPARREAFAARQARAAARIGASAVFINELVVRGVRGLLGSRMYLGLQPLETNSGP